jgi:hypothetical protein
VTVGFYCWRCWMFRALFFNIIGLVHLSEVCTTGTNWELTLLHRSSAEDLQWKCPEKWHNCGFSTMTMVMLIFPCLCMAFRLGSPVFILPRSRPMWHHFVSETRICSWKEIWKCRWDHYISCKSYIDASSSSRITGLTVSTCICNKTSLKERAWNRR